MIIIIYSETDASFIEENLGMSEYSYYFVLKEFRPVLERLGIVVAISDPAREVDAIYRSAQRHGESCIFFSFAPPQQTLVDLACPTIPVFAWEFDSMPSEPWEGEPRNDWRYVFRKLGRAITHSNFTVDLVKAAMGDDFPVVSIPSPVWDRFAALRRLPMAGPAVSPAVSFSVVGTLVDTRSIDLSRYAPRYQIPGNPPKLPEIAGPEAPARFQIDGIVYCSVLNPYDGRKNWFDMLCAFGLVFRDIPDATLVLKLTHQDRSSAMAALLLDLYKLSPFKCRVILIHGYLSDADYETLVTATTYTVNTSRGEGQCMPLMEFMACGKPAIAPTNSAMADYIDEDNAFVIRSTAEPYHWPHDPRQAYRTRRHRIDFESLLLAYRESYRVAKEDPARYARMSEQACEDQRRHCSQDVTEDRLRAFLGIAPAIAIAS